MLLHVIPSGNTILNENTSLWKNQRATWKKDRVLSEISAPEPRKDRVLTKQHRRLRGHKMLFRPLYQEIHYLLLPLSHSPLAIIFLGEPTSGDVGRHLLSGVKSPTICDVLWLCSPWTYIPPTSICPPPPFDFLYHVPFDQKVCGFTSL